MKSKKMLAQIAAFSLVFGMTGVVSSWADDIILDGTNVTFKDNAIGLVKNEDGSFTVNNQDVKGVWLQNGSNLTANHVNFINGGDGFSEISVDDKSTLTVNGGSLDSGQDAFNVNDGSKAEVNEAKVTTGAWANNAAITLKNSTTSRNWLYAGNAFPDPEDENDKGPVKEGLPVGSITIDGGTASVKNVLVQNKGQFNVTNGAVLDVTKDTSATDSAWEQPATGIMKGGEIVVRAWGPNNEWGEKENSDTINKLDKATSFTVNGKSTIKADAIDVTGNSYQKHTARAKLMVNASSTVTANTMNVGKYGYTYFKDSQLTVNGKLSVSGAADGPTNPNPVGVEMHGSSATLNEVNVKDKGYIDLDQTNITVKQLTMDSSSAEIKGGSFKAGVITVNGTDYEADKGDAQITATNSKIELNNATFIKYGHADITNVSSR